MPTGFDDVVFAISFSPDGRTLAIARGAAEPTQRFGRIELWDTETGKLRHVIKGFDGPVKSVSFSPDGQTLVSGSNEFRSSKLQQKVRDRDGSAFAELKWWNTESGELKHQLTMPGEGSSSFNVTYSPDGSQLAVAESFIEWSFLSPNQVFDLPSIGNRSPPVRSRPMMYFNADLKLLDAQTGEQKLKLGSSRPGPVSFSPDGRLVAVVNGSEVKLWNSQTGKEEQKLKGFKGEPKAIAFSPDGRTLAVASTKYYHESAGNFINVIGSSDIRLFDVRTWKVTLKVANVGAINTLAFNPSGRILLIGGVLREKEVNIPGVKLLDLQTWKWANFHTGENFTEAVDSLVLSSNGGLLAFQSGPTAVQMLDTGTWKVRYTWDTNSVGNDIERPVSRFLLSVKRVLAVAFFADSRTLAGETDQGEIKLWDPRTGEVKKQLSSDQDDPSLVAISADGKSFAEVSNGKVLICDANSGAKRIVPLTDGRSISAIAFAADGQTLAISSGSDVLLLTGTGELKKTLSGSKSAADRLAFSDDGRTLASAHDDGTIEIWNLADARIERTLMAGAGITALRFAPNAPTLATARDDHVITLWNLQTGLAQQKLQRHSAPINALAFSPDGQLLASGSDDRTVVIWETASGKSKRTLKGHDQTVTSLAFSPDGRLLASGSGNASVVVWEVRTGKLNRVLR